VIQYVALVVITVVVLVPGVRIGSERLDPAG